MIRQWIGPLVALVMLASTAGVLTVAAVADSEQPTITTSEQFAPPTCDAERGRHCGPGIPATGTPLPATATRIPSTGIPTEPYIPPTCDQVRGRHCN